MRNMVMAGAVMLAMMSIAQAQPPMPSQYAWSKGPNSIRLYLHKRGYSLVNTATKTCVGSVEGQVKVMGRTVIMRAKKSEYADADCVLTITFNKAYTQAHIKEKSCSEWHGANCISRAP
jgi:hypothetical protein